MSVKIIKLNQQARGQFNGGEILENKPIGFPREGGQLKPYSNLFYWARAWTKEGSTIGLHPHQGFEIMSIVLKNKISHFDTKLKEWIELDEGAVQIIRSGNGISHSERLHERSEMFQIWFDPNLQESLKQEASYNDFSLDQLPMVEEKGVKTIVYKGEGSPLEMLAADVEIVKKEIHAGSHLLSLDKEKTHSIYLYSGSLQAEGENIKEHDFMIVTKQDALQLKVNEDCMLFMISSPSQLDYLTYAEIQNQK